MLGMIPSQPNVKQEQWVQATKLLERAGITHAWLLETGDPTEVVIFVTRDEYDQSFAREGSNDELTTDLINVIPLKVAVTYVRDSDFPLIPLF